MQRSRAFVTGSPALWRVAMKRFLISGALTLIGTAGFGCATAEPTPSNGKEAPKAETKADAKAAEHKAEKPKAPMVYSEAKGKDERLYVFCSEKCRAHFDKSGEFPEKCITMI